jgi:5'-3' exonuclease
LTREDFIALAYFLGSDYTDGINGVGIVNALEIVQTFSMKSPEKDVSSEPQSPSFKRSEVVSHHIKQPLDGLQQFKHWLENYNIGDTIKLMYGKSIPSKRGWKLNSCPEDNKEEIDPADKIVSLCVMGRVYISVLINTISL